MSETQNEAPAWAKGDGWTCETFYDDDRILAKNGDVSFRAESDGTATLFLRCDEVHFPTPEIAREVADFILARVIQ